MARSHTITEQLNAWRAGDAAALNALMQRVYPQLKVIAAQRLAHFGDRVSLSPTELLHEGLIEVIAGDARFHNRAHFFATMSLAIRAALVDYARARNALKRGGNVVRVTLTDFDSGEDAMVFELLAIDEAMTQLERLDARCGRILHLAYFAGLKRAEIAELLDISIQTVDRDLQFARGWISKALRGGS